MNKKINNIKEAEYYTNFNLIGENIVKSRNAKPDNKPLNDMYFAWQEIGFYVHTLIGNERLYSDSLSEYRADKIRAVQRARRAEDEVKGLQEEIQKLKTRIEVGI
tara:strand:+ start:1014 stop:1328 length:315 start_codon:yes stop_codon:yes gene_type:complete